MAKKRRFYFWDLVASLYFLIAGLLLSAIGSGGLYLCLNFPKHPDHRVLLVFSGCLAIGLVSLVGFAVFLRDFFFKERTVKPETKEAGK